MRGLLAIAAALAASCSSTGSAPLTDADRETVRVLSARLCELGADELLEALETAELPSYVPDALGVLELLTRDLLGEPPPTDPQARGTFGAEWASGIGCVPEEETGCSSWTSTAPRVARPPSRSPRASAWRSLRPARILTAERSVSARSRDWRRC